MKPQFLYFVFLLVLLGCVEKPPSQPEAPGPPKKKTAEPAVMIQRMGEQIINVKALRDDVLVVEEIPDVSEAEFKAKVGEPKRYLFSKRDMSFYMFVNGKRIKLRSNE